MNARTQRTLYRLIALFLAAGAGDAIVQFSIGTTYDYRHLAGALVAAAVMAGEQYLKSSGELAAPTVAGVNAAIETNSVVPEPKVAIQSHPLEAAVPDAVPVTPEVSVLPPEPPSPSGPFRNLV